MIYYIEEITYFASLKRSNYTIQLSILNMSWDKIVSHIYCLKWETHWEIPYCSLTVSSEVFCFRHFNLWVFSLCSSFVADCFFLLNCESLLLSESVRGRHWSLKDRDSVIIILSLSCSSSSVTIMWLKKLVSAFNFFFICIFFCLRFMM